MNPNPHELSRLRHRPADLPPDLSARLHRGAVLGLLASGYAPAGYDAGYVLGERLGVADELGLPTHPGSAPWLMVVGESMGCSCYLATDGIHSWRGETDEGDRGCGEGERSNALRDCQGRGRGP